jgi:hypothetical protein
MPKTYNYNSENKKLTPVKSEKEIHYKTVKGPYNPSKGKRFTGRFGSDGSYADLD